MAKSSVTSEVAERLQQQSFIPALTPIQTAEARSRFDADRCGVRSAGAFAAVQSA